MRKHFRLLSFLFLILCVSVIGWVPVSKSVTTTSAGSATEKSMFNEYVNSIYQGAGLQQTGLNEQVFEKALNGFFNLKAAAKLPESSWIITVIDFAKSSREKRMWIVDVFNKKLILNTWVAHGQGSGDDMANQFSNTNESHQSSLGFYITDDVYFGKHGRSLRLDGMDAGFNDAARNRAIVVHAADYVGLSAITSLGRLGRSFGCPAVSPDVADQVINNIKGKTLLFISGNNPAYTSKYLKDESLINFAQNSLNTDSVIPKG